MLLSTEASVHRYTVSKEHHGTSTANQINLIVKLKSASFQLMIGCQVSLGNESCRQDDESLEILCVSNCWSFCASRKGREYVSVHGPLAIFNYLAIFQIDTWPAWRISSFMLLPVLCSGRNAALALLDASVAWFLTVHAYGAWIKWSISTVLRVQ
jgi:hypothetical protein